MPEANRRGFLLGLGLIAVSSPAIVRAAALMPIRPLPLKGQWILTERYSLGGFLFDVSAVETITFGGRSYASAAPNDVRAAIWLPPNADAPGGSRISLVRGEDLPRRVRVERPSNAPWAVSSV